MRMESEDTQVPWWPTIQLSVMNHPLPVPFLVLPTTVVDLDTLTIRVQAAVEAEAQEVDTAQAHTNPGTATRLILLALVVHTKETASLNKYTRSRHSTSTHTLQKRDELLRISS